MDLPKGFHEQDFQSRVESIVENTYLSERQAEIYVLTEEYDMKVRDCAEYLGIEKGHASKERSRIRSKLRKCKRTQFEIDMTT